MIYKLYSLVFTQMNNRGKDELWYIHSMKFNLTIKKGLNYWYTQHDKSQKHCIEQTNERKKEKERIRGKSKIQYTAWFYLHEVQELLKLYTIIDIHTVIASGWWGQRNFWNDVHVIYLCDS